MLGVGAADDRPHPHHDDGGDTAADDGMMLGGRLAEGIMPPAQSRPGTALIIPAAASTVIAAAAGATLPAPASCANVVFDGYIRGDARLLQRRILRGAGWADGTLHAETEAGQVLDASTNYHSQQQRPQPTRSLWRVACLLNIVCRSFGQVYFANNPVAGLLMFVGIAIGSPTYGLLALAACVSATISACRWQNTHRPSSVIAWADIIDGLYGYDGVLVGASLDTFLWPAASGDVHASLLVICLAVAGGFVAPIVRSAAVRVFRASGIPVFTISFNIVGLVCVFARAGGGFGVGAPPAAAAPYFAEVGGEHFSDVGFYVESFSRGVSQLTFVEDFVGSWFVVAALLVYDFGCAGLAFTGSVFGAVFAVLFAGAFTPGSNAAHLATVVAVRRGLHGYNACAAACVPHLFAIAPASEKTLPSKLVSGLRCFVAAIGMAGLSVAIGVALAGAMTQPVLTMPFVFASWLVLGCSGMPPSPPPLVPAPPRLHSAGSELNTSINPLLFVSETSPRRGRHDEEDAFPTTTTPTDWPAAGENSAERAGIVPADQAEVSDVGSPVGVKSELVVHDV